MDAECVQLRMIGWQTPTRFGLSSTGGRAIVLYSAMLSLALTTMECHIWQGEGYFELGAEIWRSFYVQRRL